MPQDSDTMFAALQKEIQGASAPTHRVSLQESIIDSIPLAISAMSGDDATMGIVSGIINRRKQQEQMMFQNELDLRKLQLDAAMKGITLERDKLESTARIGASEAETRFRNASTEQTQQETKFASEIQPLKLKKATAEITSEESLTKGRDLQNKITEQEVKHTLERATRLRQLEQGDETDRQIWQAITLTGNMPSSKEGGRPQNLIDKIATQSPRGAILARQAEKNTLDSYGEAELQTLIENQENPATAAVGVVMQPIISMIHDVARKEGATLNDKGSNLSSKASNVITQKTVNTIVPYYKKLIDLGLRDTLRNELQNILDITESKYTSVNQFEKDIALNATNFENADAQKDYLEKQVGDLLKQKTVEEQQTEEDRLARERLYKRASYYEYGR